MKLNDKAVSPVIGVILMVAITVILAAVIATFVFGVSGNTQKINSCYVPQNETFTIVDKFWDGNDNHWGYITVSDGSAYRVKDGIDYMKLQINHTYTVEMNTQSWNYPVITKVNYEVLK